MSQTRKWVNNILIIVGTNTYLRREANVGSNKTGNVRVEKNAMRIAFYCASTRHIIIHFNRDENTIIIFIKVRAFKLQFSRYVRIASRAIYIARHTLRFLPLQCLSPSIDEESTTSIKFTKTKFILRTGNKRSSSGHTIENEYSRRRSGHRLNPCKYVLH